MFHHSELEHYSWVAELGDMQVVQVGINKTTASHYLFIETRYTESSRTVLDGLFWKIWGLPLAATK